MSEILLHISHFISENHSEIFFSLASLAVIIAALSWTVRTSLREHHYRVSHQAISRWDEILSIYNENPDLLDADLPRVHVTERSSFDAINYRAWSLVDYITDNKLDRDNQFRTIIYWISLHNKGWLDENPFMFSSKNFWKVLDSISDEPLTLYRSEPLPELNRALTRREQPKPKPDKYEEDIDWEFVAEHYDEKVMNPFANEMVIPSSKGQNTIRNGLLGHLDSLPDLKRMRIADYGCGPGNILKFLTGKADAITGIDFSRRALDIATRRAQEARLTFLPVEKDIRHYRPDKDKGFHLIISINSILPPPASDSGRTQTTEEGRNQVLEMLTSIREGLDVGGTLLAILPSFDTTERLLQYWEEHYRRMSRNIIFVENKEYVQKSIKAIRMKKKVNQMNKSFADDNIHSQCFHTPETIDSEFKKVGLNVSRLEKIYYPWEMARRFDYGYFPGKEEIWDWFVVAKRGPVGADHDLKFAK